MAACSRTFHFTNGVLGSSQAFNWLDQSALVFKTLIYTNFTSKLQLILSELGFQASAYAGHSFRRGGASFAYSAGVPIELIKVLGEWQSDAVLLYLTIPLTIRLKMVNILTKTILSTLHSNDSLVFGTVYL